MNKQPAVTPRKLLAIAGMGWLFDAMDVGILSFIIAALHTDWNLTPDQMKWIGSVNSIGMAAGAFVFGMLADRIGRKKVFMITLLFFSVGSGISAFATGLTVFLILRFLIGMGLGGELPVASTLVSEASAPEKRGRIIVLLESFWAAGWLLAAVISYFVIPSFGWQAALLLTALAAFYALYLRRSLPESPAHQALPQKKSIRGQAGSVWAKPYIRPTVLLSVVWFCVVFSYYGMFLWLPSVMLMKGYSMIESFEYVLLMTLAQLPGYFSAAWLIEKAGRKTILVIYLLGTAGSAYFFGAADSLAMLLTAGMLLSFFNLGAWGVLYAYTPEQYPAAIRATGSGTTAAVGRIGGIFGPLLVGSLAARNVSFTVIFAVFCAAILIAVITIIILGKETKQTELAQ
ncbi:MFS transporter [Bacillus velezensis]|uniref:MFS transporter n=1 Tax=Bacillus velezensis TaxID=492670 RepID=UPI000F024CDF|nr:MFS transporter [Bacillus velezensis]MDK4256614.1 MFS transporter [Bacillus velezensis]MEC2354150.1 MFS transporter [Bacillus velezensis]MED3402174.1 MFS transporter [Bacillus velezensis]QHK07541.1 Putative niacin/nicotinamide transporter NaiP [Bacillus velezensis]QHK09187.1 Putative niacin/nicotinamide transporter NaiP [Bacillus velezensis]